MEAEARVGPTVGATPAEEVVTMTGTTSHTGSRRMRLSALLAVALLTAGCGSDGGDSGGDSGDSGGSGGSGGNGEGTAGPADSSYTLSSLEEFSIEANSLCRDLLTTTIGEDPGSYADAADQLEALPRPDDERATELVTTMRAFVDAHDAVVSRVAQLPDFESPPGTWFLVESGAIFVSRSGSLDDMEDSGLPTSLGRDFVDAREALSEAAWSAEAPNCEAVEEAPE